MIRFPYRKEALSVLQQSALSEIYVKDLPKRRNAGTDNVLAHFGISRMTRNDEVVSVSMFRKIYINHIALRDPSLIVTAIWSKMMLIALISISTVMYLDMLSGTYF